MHVFYQPDLSQSVITLTEEESKHAVRVLRKQPGDEIDLADGKGTQAKAIVEEANPKRCKLAVKQTISHQPTRNYHLHFLIAPTKNFDRMEWAIEKLTEIGVDEITFIEAKNSERDKVNLERCQKVAISAMKQSKQWHLPKINPILPITEAIKLVADYPTKLIAWCPTNEQVVLSKVIQPTQVVGNKSLAILIGPEGDFNPDEAALATQNGFNPISLGPTILRTETAAVACCAQIHALVNA